MRSYNISDCYVYHNSNNQVLIANRSAGLSVFSSKWKIVRGLADHTHVSFESTDMPGYYLRHQDGQIRIAQNDGTNLFAQDATWIVHENQFYPGTLSFESYNIPNRYMRHYNSYLRIDEITSNSGDLIRKDASFYLEME